MREIVSNLRRQPVLNKEDIVFFRTSIDNRHPGADPKKKAAILADLVHNRIDQHMPGLESQTRARIRASLLQRAISLDHFDIHAGDILGMCLLMPGDHGTHLETLTGWVNKRQEIVLSHHDLLEFTQFHIHNLVASDLEFLLERLGEYTAAPVVNKESSREIPTCGDKQAKALVTHVETSVLLKKHAPGLLVACSLLLCILLFAAVKTFVLPPTISQAKDPVQPGTNHLPVELRYKAVDTEKLRQFLNKRNSILSDEPYFSAIIQSAKRFNINPLLLFAITGQEQGFVPRNHQEASRIANNPFNVYRSWKEYNTNIQDSADIAAVTLLNLSKDRPETIDPIAWINRKYSEDNQWQTGVKQILEELNEEAAEATE